MKTSDTQDGAWGADPEELPKFTLEYLVDDIDNPTQVMVVPRGTGDRPGTAWIVIDMRHAVPLEWVR